MNTRLNRHKVLKEAKITVDSATMACLIENLSDGGAALIFPDQNCPAKRFSLMAQGLPERECEVVWQRASLVGVRFV